MKIVNQLEWENWLEAFPDAHILQSGSWGKLKSKFGWEPVYFAGKDCGALILFKALPFGFKIGYIPKGPVGLVWTDLWPEVESYCLSNRAIFLKIEPDLWLPEQGKDLQELTHYAEMPSETIQPRRTIVVSLRDSEDEWLNRMKQKTRYNIRLAERKKVRVDVSSDVSLFSEMMQVTGKRDGFGVHNERYYQEAYSLFKQTDDCELLLAYYGDQPLSGLMVFKHGSRSWYLFGASNNLERNRMPTYLIQWEAMRWAGKHGCHEYDLWGAPDENLETLEAQFKNHNNGLWGVYRFKRGFGGEVKRSVGAWDKVFYSNIYRGYQWFMKLRKSAI